MLFGQTLVVYKTISKQDIYTQRVTMLKFAIIKFLDVIIYFCFFQKSISFLKENFIFEFDGIDKILFQIY